MARITVRVQPKASSNEIVGYDDSGVLRVRVTAPPADGAANRALIVTLAAALGVPKSGIIVVRGDTARVKQVEIAGLTDADVRARVLQAQKPVRKG